MMASIRILKNTGDNMKYTPAIKLTLHDKYRQFIKKEPSDNYLLNIELSPSGKCKAGCKWCFYRNNLTNDLLDETVLDKTLTDLEEMGAVAITWSGGGEPTAHPSLPKMIEQHPKLSHGFFTNALYPIKVNAECVKWVRITWTPNLQKENIEQFSDIKNLGMVINYSGDDEMVYKVLALAENTNIKYIDVRPALGIKGNTVDIKPPSINHPLLRCQEYKFSNANEKHQYKKCYGHNFVPFISETGNVYVCNYMLTDEYKLGSIYESSIKDIMKRAPRTFPVASNCQVCCKNHEINTLLNLADNLNDINFV